MKLLYVFFIINFLINNKIFAVKCTDLKVGHIYNFQDKTYLYLYPEQPHIDRHLTVYIPKIESDKKNQKYFISGVLKKLDDLSFIFKFNICIDIDSKKSLITNYSEQKHEVSNKKFELSDETPKIETYPLDFEVLEPDLFQSTTKRSKIETEGQTNDYEIPEAITLSSSSQLKEAIRKFIFPTKTYIVYKVDNIILKIFPKQPGSDYKGLLIYNKLHFYIPFRELKLTHDGYLRIKLIGWLKLYQIGIRYNHEYEYDIPLNNLLLVDENDYEDSYKDLNFPDYFKINGCQILYDNFTKNGITIFRLQKNIIIDIKSMQDRNLGIGVPHYYIIGKIFINGDYYQIVECKITTSDSKIKYLMNGTGNIYAFNILDFLI